MATGASATARIQPKKQTLDDAYAPPANFLEIDLVNPETHGIGNKRYTDYELKMRVSVLRTASYAGKVEQRVRRLGLRSTGREFKSCSR